MNKLIVFLLAVFLVLCGILGYSFWRNSLSRSDMRLEILGPDQVVAGQEVEYIVKFKNNSNSKLEDIRLTVEFPSHTVLDGGGRAAIRDEKEIGSLQPGDEKSFSFKARMFGAIRDAKKIQVLLMYRPAGIKARFPTKAEFSTVIKEVPINLAMEAQSKIESGKEIKLSLNYGSDIDFDLKDVKIETQYPANFDFISGDPKPEGHNYWPLNELKKGENGKIEIRGYLSGDVGAKKTFKAKIGFSHEGEFVSLKETEFSIGVEEPAIDISETVNGSERYGANLGETLNYEIKFKNISDQPYHDLFMGVRLKGDLFDLSSIKAEGAQIDSATSAIIWEPNATPELKLLAPGEEGTVRFSIKTLSQIPREFRSPGLISKVIVGQNQKEFITRVNSKLDLAQTVQINDDIFLSEGPVPPVAGEANLYTIFWDVKNYFNDAKEIVIKATLSGNVEFMGTVSPESESQNVSFNNDSKELVWNVGDVAAGIGLRDKRRILAFQIRLTPPLSQAGQYAPLIEKTSISGLDDWTKKDLNTDLGRIDSSVLGEVEGKVRTAPAKAPTTNTNQ